MRLPDADQVAHVVLSRVRDLVRAESAELLLCTGPTAIRMRLSGQDDFTIGPAEADWPQMWQPAWNGVPVLVADAKHARARPHRGTRWRCRSRSTTRPAYSP